MRPFTRNLAICGVLTLMVLGALLFAIVFPILAAELSNAARKDEAPSVEALTPLTTEVRRTKAHLETKTKERTLDGESGHCIVLAKGRLAM